MGVPYSILSKIRFTVLLTSLLLAHTAKAQDENPKSILFVGNSYTYFWNMPQVFQAMCESQGKKVVARQSTAGGTSLEQHWKGEKELLSKSLIETTHWDYVVLQNLSTSTIDTPDEFSMFGKYFISLIKKSNSIPLLYMTWAREYKPSMQDTITTGYEKLGNDTKTKVIPVGKIWMQVHTNKPELMLYDNDGSHPSPIGTYLIALCFYKYIIGLPTAEIPNRLISKDKDGEKLYLSILSQQDADYLQAVVDAF